jgi:hypothetical protein
MDWEVLLMSKLYYCLECKRISEKEEGCTYCGSHNLKELGKNAPVNVMGSKLKGRVLKVDEGRARLLIVDETNSKYIKEYEAEQLRKIL